MLPGVSVDEVGSALRVRSLMASGKVTGMTMVGGGMGFGVGVRSAASLSKESPSSPSPSPSPPSCSEGGLTSKLTEDEEEGFGCDTERRALGGREVAGIGWRWMMEEDCGLEPSVEEEYV